jgi:tripartite motif-containing protein 71
MSKRTIHILLLCAVFLLPTGIAPLPPNTAALLEEPYVFLQSWGNEMGVFHGPTGIAISGDRVYVCDTHSSRIQIFDLHGLTLAAFGEPGSGDGRFYYPSGIAVDGSRNVYVSHRFP